MNARTSRAACGCVDEAHTPPENVVTIWISRGKRPYDIDARKVHELAQLLEAELHLALRDQRADRNAGRRRHDPALDLVGDAPALEQLRELHAARAGRVAERSRGDDRAAQRVFAADVGARSARAHRNRNARPHQVDLAAGNDTAARDELVDRIGGQDHDVERLARLHAFRRVDSADRFDGDIGLGLRTIELRELGQYGPRRHGRDAGDAHGCPALTAKAGARARAACGSTAGPDARSNWARGSPGSPRRTRDPAARCRSSRPRPSTRRSSLPCR